MTERSRYSTHTTWEDTVGYSRAIMVGNTIEVSGTVSADENGIVHPDNAKLQTRYILEKIGTALHHFNATYQHVVRVRVYATDIADFEAITSEYSKIFIQVKPAMTLVAIASLVDPSLKLEIEVTAVV